MIQNGEVEAALGVRPERGGGRSCGLGERLPSRSLAFIEALGIVACTLAFALSTVQATMSHSICSRCLSRSLASIEISSSTSLSSAQRSAFSTTSALSANPPKKKNVSAKPSARQGRTLRLSKNKRETTGRPPAPGERKAVRKRIVLSNTNALEVKGLQDLDWENGRSTKLAELEKQVLGLTNDTVDALRALEAFEHTQGWNLFRRPATLVRKETVEMARALEGAEGNEGAEKKAVRKVLFGEKGSGKSVLLLQAQAMALQRGWIVVHLPNGMYTAQCRYITADD